jgi:uncharacterized protein (DUF488 family)
MRLYTIGHGNLDIDSFLGILRENQVDWVADLRSAPYSRLFPWFNKNELALALEDAGIRYVFLGQLLGGKPREGESTSEWKQGHLNYELVSALSRSTRWAEGIENLAALVKSTDEDGEPGCLLCSEKDPNNCHRSLVSFNIESALPGLSVTHLGHDSAVREAKFQDTLFAVADD